MSNVDEAKVSLLLEICESLNNTHIKLHNGENCKFDLNEHSIVGLSYLPLINLTKISQYKFEDGTTYPNMVSQWERNGFFNFSPYIIKDVSKNVTLCAGFNKFIHMWKGYYFSITDTVDGVGEVRTGNYETKFMTYWKNDNDIIRHGLVTYLLWWAAFIDCSFTCPNISKAFKTDKSVLEEFINKSYHYWGGQSDYHWKDIEQYIEIGSGKIDIQNRQVFQLKNYYDDVIAYMAMGVKSVQVETADNHLITIHIPNPCIGTYYMTDPNPDEEDFMNDVEYLQQNHYIEMILLMAVNLSGITLNWDWCNLLWGFGENKSMPCLEQDNIITVKDIRGFNGVLPDQY